MNIVFNRAFILSIVVPCYNEEKSLETCIETVLQIQDSNLRLEIIIVDDCSTDKSHKIALLLAQKHPQVKVLQHEHNQGKGAALRTGFKHVTGEFVAIQDADLEYDCWDLRKLLVPLVDGKADVIFGSRYLNSDSHRILYFWHSLMNRTLTFLSNMFTGLDMTDMETCYKVFRREILNSIEIEENRFGFEPEIVAKVAQKRVRIYEMGIKYNPRTYAEGKKINWRDGIAALYCVFYYNAHKAPLPIQFLIYFFIGLTSALFNVVLFLFIYKMDFSLIIATTIAFCFAALLNYVLCIKILFRHKTKWTAVSGFLFYILLVSLSGIFDVMLTQALVIFGLTPFLSKSISSFSFFVYNFLVRKFIVFPEERLKPW